MGSRLALIASADAKGQNVAAVFSAAFTLDGRPNKIARNGNVANFQKNGTAILVEGGF